MLIQVGEGGGGLIVDIRAEGGGVMQKKESPDFRFPKVGISVKGLLLPENYKL